MNDRAGLSSDRRAQPAIREMTPESRARFDCWVRGQDDAGALVEAFERRAWHDAALGFPLTYCRLAPEDLARLRDAIVRAVEAAGGRVELGHAIYSLAEGRLKVELPT